MYLKRDKLWTEELHQMNKKNTFEQKDTTMLKTIQKFEIGQLAAGISGISHKVKMSKLLPRLWNVKFGMIRFKR